jgi:hypothetical protein
MTVNGGLIGWGCVSDAEVDSYIASVKYDLDVMAKRKKVIRYNFDKEYKVSPRMA